MTRDEWLVSDDPQKMLGEATAPYNSDLRNPGWRVSDRKLRLWCVALAMTYHGSGKGFENALLWIDGKAPPAPSPTRWLVYDLPAAQAAADCVQNFTKAGIRPVRRMTPAGLAGNRKRLDTSVAADLLRCVAGDPFEPVGLPKTRRVEIDADPEGGYPAGYRMECPWLTPQVLTLAQAVYEERLDDGTLDPFRLALLADALEEAGCAGQRSPIRVVVYGVSGGHSWEVVGRERGGVCARHREPTLAKARQWAEKNFAAKHWARFPGAGVHTSTDRLQSVPHWTAEGLTPDAPHPLLAHLRSPGPHVRGCWAMDCLLGKS